MLLLLMTMTWPAVGMPQNLPVQTLLALPIDRSDHQRFLLQVNDLMVEAEAEGFEYIQMFKVRQWW